MVQGIVHRIGGDKRVVGRPNHHVGVGHDPPHFLHTVSPLYLVGGEHRHLGHNSALFGRGDKGFGLPQVGFIGDKIKDFFGFSPQPVRYDHGCAMFQFHPTSTIRPFCCDLPLLCRSVLFCARRTIFIISGPRRPCQGAGGVLVRHCPRPPYGCRPRWPC